MANKVKNNYKVFAASSGSTHDVQAALSRPATKVILKELGGSGTFTAAFKTDINNSVTGDAITVQANERVVLEDLNVVSITTTASASYEIYVQ